MRKSWIRQDCSLPPCPAWFKSYTTANISESDVPPVPQSQELKFWHLAVFGTSVYALSSLSPRILFCKMGMKISMLDEQRQWIWEQIVKSTVMDITSHSSCASFAGTIFGTTSWLWKGKTWTQFCVCIHMYMHIYTHQQSNLWHIHFYIYTQRFALIMNVKLFFVYASICLCLCLFLSHIVSAASLKGKAGWIQLIKAQISLRASAPSAGLRATPFLWTTNRQPHLRWNRCFAGLFWVFLSQHKIK